MPGSVGRVWMTRRGLGAVPVTPGVRLLEPTDPGRVSWSLLLYPGTQPRVNPR